MCECDGDIADLRYRSPRRSEVRRSAGAMHVAGAMTYARPATITEVETDGGAMDSVDSRAANIASNTCARVVARLPTDSTAQVPSARSASQIYISVPAEPMQRSTSTAISERPGRAARCAGEVERDTDHDHRAVANVRRNQDDATARGRHVATSVPHPWATRDDHRGGDRRRRYGFGGQPCREHRGEHVRSRDRHASPSTPQRRCQAPAPLRRFTFRFQSGAPCKTLHRPRSPPRRTRGASSSMCQSHLDRQARTHPCATHDDGGFAHRDHRTAEDRPEERCVSA